MRLRLLEDLFQLSFLVHFVVLQADSLLAVLPDLPGSLWVTNSVGLFVLKDLAARTTSSSGFAIWTPSSNSLGTPVPAPVDTGLVTLRIVNDLRQTLTGLLHRNVAAGDVLHEERENVAEPLSLFAEKIGLSNTTRVHAGKYNAGVLVVSSVQFRDCHHVADLYRVGNGKIVVSETFLTSRPWHLFRQK